FDRECAGAGRCASDRGLDRVCATGLPECDEPRRNCPPGFACADGTCQPAFVLDAQTRHACRCDAQCEFPLRCVSFVIPDSTGLPAMGHGGCDPPCPSDSDAWCRGAPSCQPISSGTPWSGVCSPHW